MSSLDEVLNNANRARLIPNFAKSSQEMRLVSILLAVLGSVRPFTAQLLVSCGVRVGKKSEMDSFTEVKLTNSKVKQTDRPDGVLIVRGRSKISWTALFEAKVGNSEIDEEQILRYGKAAQAYGLDAVITLSNQLVPLPSHIPYSVPKPLSQKLGFYHFSWTSIRTQAMLTLKDSEDLSPEQRFILEEMVRYLEHPTSGVKSFDRMNREWQSLVLGIKRGEQFKKNWPEIENTVASWHQEERDVCLILTRRIGKRVDIRLSRKHRKDIELRFREACDDLVVFNELRSGFDIPNAANDLEVTVNLQRRTISCSMKLQAPGDKKTPKARINWILRQLHTVKSQGVFIRAFWAGRSLSTHAALSKVQADPGCLEIERPNATLTAFEVVVVTDPAGRFSGRSTFIEDLEKTIPSFYDRVGQNLHKWVPSPPTIENGDPVQSQGDPVKSSDVNSESENALPEEDSTV